MQPPGRRRSVTVRLADGARVRLRAVTPEDRALIAAGFERLSETSRYRRFFSPMPGLDAATLRYLTEIDHHDHEAVIALEADGGLALGVARFVRLEPGGDTAEAAVVVTDDWQGRGVGGALLRRLATRARQEGVRNFTALVKAENPVAVEALKGIGTTEITREGSDLHLLIALPRRGTGATLTRALRAAAAGSVSAAESVTERLRHGGGHGGP